MTAGEDDAATHVAGIDLTLDGRYIRQRCAWCGRVLIDVDLTRVAVPEGQDPSVSTWPVGALVRVTNLGGGGYASTVLEAEPDKLPEDSCSRLDPEVTA